MDDPGNDDFLSPERQADDFASDIIFPNFLFRPLALKLRKPSLALIREIAELFQASTTATILKLIRCNIYPIIAVCHNKRGRRWFCRSAMLDQWWFPRNDLDADSFAFDMLFRGVGDNPMPRKIGAGAWFEFRNVDRFEISEQSFLLPNEEVLTLLVMPFEASSR